MATAEQLVFRPSDLIDRLLADAKTPHLLPVRAGEINRVRRQDFVRTHPEREERQILNFLNMDNGLLAFNDRSRKDSVYDNGASAQSLKFDDLRDGKGTASPCGKRFPSMILSSAVARAALLIFLIGRVWEKAHC